MNRQPFNIEAERAVIGAVFEDSSVFPQFEHLRPDHFATGPHARAWAAIRDLVSKGKRADPISVRTALNGDAELAELDRLETRSGDYLHRLAVDAPGADIAAEHAELVLEEWTRRQVLGLCNTARTLTCETNPRPASEVVADLKAQLDTLEAMAAPEDGLQAAQDVAGEVIRDLVDNMRSGRVIGKPCGLACVDRRLGGLRPGKLIVLAGRPSMGKTALARNIADGCARQNPDDAVLFLACEMSPAELTERALSAVSHRLGDDVQYRDIGRGQLDAWAMSAVQKASGHLPRNLFYRDCHGLTVDDVRRAVWAAKRKHKLSLVVIDYLQLMRLPRAAGRNDASLWGEVTSALKAIARQAGVCILLLSQLSRQVESREDKRPQLSDLRESGAIEQDADACLFCYRESYYLERTMPKRGQGVEHDMRLAEVMRHLDVITLKNRGGAIGTDRQTYFAEYDHVIDWEEA